MKQIEQNRLDMPETRSEVEIRIEELQKRRRENAAKGFARMAEQEELTELLKKRKEARGNAKN